MVVKQIRNAVQRELTYIHEQCSLDIDIDKEDLFYVEYTYNK